MCKIFVADFGGTTVHAWMIDPDSIPRRPVDLTDPLGEPAGYVLRSDGSAALGLELYDLSCDTPVDRICPNLGDIPTPGNRDDWVFYLAQWQKKLRRDNPREFEGVDSTRWLVGCPVGGEWEKEVVRVRWRQLFERAGFENVILIPEPAALAAGCEAEDYVLIDAGGDSLKAVWTDGGEAQADSCRLGAGIIERMIVHSVLYGDEALLRRQRTEINPPAVVAAARARFEREGADGYFHACLLLQARRLKERYFTALRDGSLRAHRDLTLNSGFASEGTPLLLYTSNLMMQDILESRPVRDVLGDAFHALPREVCATLGGMSWMQAFREFLDKLSGRSPRPDAVLLSGGGAQMECVVEAVSARFPDSRLWECAGLGPGLALSGPEWIKAAALRRAFEALVDQRVDDGDGGLTDAVSHRLNQAFNACVAGALDEVVREKDAAIDYAIGQWVDYRCSSAEIPAKLERHFQDWRKHRGLSGLESSIRAKIDWLRGAVNGDLELVMDGLGSSREVLMRSEDEEYLKTGARAMVLAYEDFIDQIVAHFKQHEIWSMFPNKDKGFFSDPRAGFLSAIQSDLNEWKAAETGGMTEVFTDFYTRTQVDLSGGGNTTIAGFFIHEGRQGLKAMLDKRVEGLLGRHARKAYLGRDR